MNDGDPPLDDLTPEERRQDELLEAAYDAVEDDLPEDALEILERMDPDVPERWTLSADIWGSLGEHARAGRALERARELLDPDDPYLAWAEAGHFVDTWRFDEARAALARMPDEELDATAMHLHALLCDVEGDYEAADGWLARAREREPEAGFDCPRLEPEAFERVVDEAARQLPVEFHMALAEIPVVIDPMPTAALLGAPESGHPPTTLGLFTGPSLTDGDSFASGELRPTIFLFQRNIERDCHDLDDLREQIRVTLYHELGHALGFDEEGVDDMGLA